MITTTLNKIRKHNPCEEGWEKLLKHLGKTKADDEPIPLLTVLESNGLYDAVWCARKVEHLMADKRSIKMLEVAERYVKGEATEKELATAARIAKEAARDAAARATAGDAIGDARDAAARAAVGVAIGDTVWAASWAAAAARAVAAGTVGDDQEQEFKRIIS